MFKSTKPGAQNDRLSQLLCSRNGEQSYEEEYTEQMDHHDNQHQSDNGQVIVFSQNNHTHNGDCPSEIEFSQSFTGPYRFAGTESARDHSHNQRTMSISLNNLEKEIAAKDQQLALKDQQIKQLTDFLNKKKKEEGNVNSIYEEEFTKLQEDIAKKDILNCQLTKKAAVLETELSKYRKLNDENYNELIRLNQNVEILEEFKRETEELMTKLTKALEQMEDENIKLKEANRRMADVLGDNVSEHRINNVRKEKEREDVSALSIKYQELKKKTSQKDKTIVECKEQILKLENTLQSKDKQIESLNRSLSEKNEQIRNTKEKQQRMGEMQKRIKHLKEQCDNKQTKILQQANELTEKSKTILRKTQSQSQLKSRLELEAHRIKEGQKEIDILNQKNKVSKQTINKLQKQVESLKNNQAHYRKEQGLAKQVEKQQQIFKVESVKNSEKYQKQINEKDQLINQLKKKLQDSEKKMQQLRSKCTSNDEEIKQLTDQLDSEREKFRKQTGEITKRQSQFQSMQNKIIILEAKVEKYASMNQQSAHQQYEEKIRCFEMILKKRNQMIEQLQSRLELHSNEIDKEISQDLINYNLQQVNEHMGNDSASTTIAHLKGELKEKYEIIQRLQKDNQMKSRSIQFTMHQFLKSEQEKLMMEQNIVNKGSRYTNLEDSTEQNYYDRENEQDYQYEVLLNRCETLEQRNKQLQDQIKDLEDTKYKSTPTEFSKNNLKMKHENSVLKKEIQDLKEELDKLREENKRIGNIDQLTSREVIQLLIQLLQRIYKSQQMKKAVLRNSEFLQLIKRITKRQEKETGPTFITKRSQ